MNNVPKRYYKRRRTKYERRRELVAYSFLAPNFIGFAVFTLLPVLFSIFLSFVKWKGGSLSSMEWIGLGNYADIFKSAKVAEKGLGYLFTKVDLGIALKNTLLFTLLTVPLTLVCAMALSLALNRAVKGAVGFRTVFFFPYVASMVAICVCWRFMMMKDGPINQMIMALGGSYNKSWTADSTMAMWSIILVSVWRNMGYYMVIYLAALQGIPTDLYEAATVDGASKWQRLVNVTLPQLRPTTFFASTMLIISCFKIYDVVAIMTEGGPGRSTKMLVTYIYDEAFSNFNYGTASAIAMVLLVIVLIFTLAQFSMEERYANN